MPLVPYRRPNGGRTNVHAVTGTFRSSLPRGHTPRPRGSPSVPGSPAAPLSASAAQPAGDVVRWAVFSCVLAPVVLLAYGTSLGGAAGTALGLAAVTAACRVLLRRSERHLGGKRPRNPARTDGLARTHP
ncbi:hypothetical protein ACGFMM_21490 [Streptomyces sp. NPDC048604]|uniref:hypothetical protein n=1 Tax=Streptomyces sp. NPDC048604 TaxID=3365578 RepID=UPI003721CAFF